MIITMTLRNVKHYDTLLTMTPITLSKKSLPKDDLVIIARKDYERMLKRIKFDDELDKHLKQAFRDVKEGKLNGPFSTAEELMKSIES